MSSVMDLPVPICCGVVHRFLLQEELQYLDGPFLGSNYDRRLFVECYRGAQ